MNADNIKTSRSQHSSSIVVEAMPSKRPGSKSLYIMIQIRDSMSRFARNTFPITLWCIVVSTFLYPNILARQRTHMVNERRRNFGNRLLQLSKSADFKTFFSRESDMANERSNRRPLLRDGQIGYGWRKVTELTLQWSHWTFLRSIYLPEYTENVARQKDLRININLYPATRRKCGGCILEILASTRLVIISSLRDGMILTSDTKRRLE